MANGKASGYDYYMYGGKCPVKYKQNSIYECFHISGCFRCRCSRTEEVAGPRPPVLDAGGGGLGMVLEGQEPAGPPGLDRGPGGGGEQDGPLGQTNDDVVVGDDDRQARSGVGRGTVPTTGPSPRPSRSTSSKPPLNNLHGIIRGRSGTPTGPALK